MGSINDSSVSGTSGQGSGQSGAYAAPGPVRDPAHLGRGSGKMMDMDRTFLYRGETGEVAAEFEKRSGMSREEFFNQIAAAADSGLSFDDPNLMDKMEKRYQSFVDRIPNQEYKSNLEKAHSMLSLVKKTQFLQELAGHYVKNRWGAGEDPQQTAKGEANGKGSAVTAASGGAEKSNGADRGPASEALPLARLARIDDNTPKLSKDQMGMYLGLEGSHSDELRDVMGSLLGADSDSIFRLVSKRYRKLTPALLGKAVVMESK
jgi:hypothetical protein